jgi:hypothetical protein
MMRRRALALGILGLVACGCFPGGGAPAKGRARVIPCRRATSKIVIDGKLDEAAWENARPVDDFAIPPTGAKPRHPTSARLLWDDQFLYLGVVMEDFDVTAVKKDHDAWLWEDDVCELFLKPSTVDHHYYELQVTPLGTTLDLLIPRRGAGTFDRWKTWESGIKAAIAISGTLNDWHDQDKGWVVEAAIPLAAFAPDTHKPQLGDHWRFAVCRYDYSVYLDEGRELSSSARLSKLNFHWFEDYDILEFSE